MEKTPNPLTALAHYSPAAPCLARKASAHGSCALRAPRLWTLQEHMCTQVAQS